MSLDVEAFADVILGAIRRELEPLAQRLAELERRAPVNGQDGAPGEKGERGEPGPRGERGEKGEKGDRGETGPAGPGGRDGRDGLPGPAGEKGLDGKPGADGKDGRDGKDGLDGFGFDDLDVEYDGERAFTFRFTKAGRVKAFPFRLPLTIYRGIYDGAKAYEVGDQVTHAGSMWIATAPTKEVPGEGASAWVLSTKRGRDGKPGPQGSKGADGKDGRPGRDLTQMDRDGRKW